MRCFYSIKIRKFVAPRCRTPPRTNARERALALRLSLRDKRSPALTAPQTLPSARLGDLAVATYTKNSTWCCKICLCLAPAALRLAPFFVFWWYPPKKAKKEKEWSLLLFLVTTKIITIKYVGGQQVRLVTSQQKFNTPLINFLNDIKQDNIPPPVPHWGKRDKVT